MSVGLTLRFLIKYNSLLELPRPWLRFNLAIAGCEHRCCGLQGRPAPPRLVSGRPPPEGAMLHIHIVTMQRLPKHRS